MERGCPRARAPCRVPSLPRGDARGHLPADPERHVTLRGSSWRKKSPAAKAFVLRLLERDLSVRPSAAGALRDPWLVQNGVGAADADPDHKERKSMAPRTTAGSHARPARRSGVPDAVIERMQTHARFTDVKRAVMLIMVHAMDRSTVAALTRHFKTIDRDADGRVSREELAAELARHGVSKSAADKIFAAFDQDASDSIRLSELLVGMVEDRLTTAGAGSCEALHDAFDAIDIDGSGRITLVDVARFLQIGTSKLTTPRSESSLARLPDAVRRGVVEFMEMCGGTGVDRGQGERASSWAEREAAVRGAAVDFDAFARAMGGVQTRREDSEI